MSVKNKVQIRGLGYLLRRYHNDNIPLSPKRFLINKLRELGKLIIDIKKINCTNKYTIGAFEMYNLI